MTDEAGWYESDLGQLLALIRNGYAGQQVNHITAFPVSRIETISNGVVDLTKVGYVEGVPESYRLQAGDILISNINSVKHIGKVAQVEPEVRLYHGMNLLILRSIDDVDSRLLFFVLSAAKLWFEKMAAQAINQASINQTTIKSLSLRLPSKRNEQSKIAEILSTVDRAIEQTDALIGKQQRIKTGLMQDLLTHGIDEHGKLRSEETHPFKDSPLGRIPVEWKVKTIGAVIAGINAGWSPSCPDEAPSEGEWGVLKVSAVSAGVYQPSESKRLPPELTPVESIEVKAGDVLMTRSNGVADLVGKCALVEQTPTRLMLSDKTLRLCPSVDQITSFVLFAALSSHTSRLQILVSLNGSSGQKNISQTQIRSIHVCVPLVDEQGRIERALQAQIASISQIITFLKKLRSLKIALMQDLLTGKVRVKNDCDTEATSGSQQNINRGINP